jgi:CheY-like chemotaxis protein
MPDRTSSPGSERPSYTVTEAGRKVWQSQDNAIPRNFRLMLWLMDSRGAEFLDSLASRYSSPALWGLLGELEELKFIRRAGGGSKPLPPLVSPEGAFAAEEARSFESELQSASQSVLRGRAYVPELRRKRRGPRKPASETVVLIVEDDPDQLALADLRVSMAGYRVWVAESAKALEETLAAKGLPDALVLDVMLPDGDGFEILRRLRANDASADLPVVLLTARTGLDDILAGLRLGADGYLTKPYAKATLEEMLKQVLQPG